MKKSTRILILLITLEALIVVLGGWLISGLANGTLHAATTPADASATVFSVLGSVAGVIAGVLGVVWFVLRRRGL